MRFIKAALLVTLAGCPDRPVGAVYPESGNVEVKDIPAVPNRNADILFLIDNSGSMDAEQASLRANFGRFMAVLETIEGGLPNVHIGVATSNLGQSATDGVGTASFGPSCANKGDDGAMRTAPVINGRFIVDEETTGGARNRNYSGTLADAFSAIANVGIDGCGIEQHLGAVKRSLENPVNAGFLRDDAKLTVIVIGDEDDCSLAHKSLFEGSTNGTEVNFRCTQGGIECDGDPNLTIVGEHTNCHPKDPSPYLNPISTYIDYLRSLKAHPDDDVIVAGIVGDPEPFKIAMDGGQTVLGASCMYGDQSAFPAVRTTEFLKAFPQSIETTICGADLSGPLVQIAALLKRSFGDPCFENQVIDLDPATPGLQADCTVTDVQVNGGNETELGVLPSCTTGTIPCWRIEDDAQQCYYTEYHQKLVIDRGGVVPPSDLHVKVNCVTAGSSGSFQ
ncbi:MAG TPA: vWA domain-containing protein [Kofleriaceae bacterium]|nr:vWA domain-containing protein [Kofleriaceae bacterium]